MIQQQSIEANATEQFVAAAGALATKFGWPAKSMDREDETVFVALTVSDPAFERMIWVYEPPLGCIRCLLVSKFAVSSNRRTEVLELCARINEGLRFGCVEYSFADNVVVFRDSAEMPVGNISEIVEATTARLLDLAARYAPALSRTLAGETAITVLG